MAQVVKQNAQSMGNNGYLILGAGLALASMIILPAVAVRMGLGSSLTGALRIALMKASSRATAIACKATACEGSEPCR